MNKPTKTKSSHFNKISKIGIFMLTNGSPGTIEILINMPLISARNMKLNFGKISFYPKDLYRGLMITCLPYFTYKVGMFGINEKLTKTFKVYDEEEVKRTGIKRPKIMRSISAGIISGICAAAMICPFERIQVHQQRMLYDSLREAIKSVKQKAGFKGFYHGAVGSFSRDICYTTFVLQVSFIVKGLLHTKFSKISEKYPRFLLALSGIITGSFVGLITCPMDTLRIQQMGDIIEDMRSSKTIIKDLYREGGIKRLFNGWELRVARIANGAWIQLLTFTTIQKMFENFNSD